MFKLRVLSTYDPATDTYHPCDFVEEFDTEEEAEEAYMDWSYYGADVEYLY